MARQRDRMPGSAKGLAATAAKRKGHNDMLRKASAGLRGSISMLDGMCLFTVLHNSGQRMFAFLNRKKQVLSVQ
ncbi:hypothetical protein D3Z52_07805 [Clostridiaceae bacterium]|nr:hypothetical protein [Clostridiaceae bacterium]